MHDSTPLHSFRIPVLGRLHDAWSSLRRRLSSRHHNARLLKLPTFESPDEAGLVLVQIDGLSQHLLEQALARGDMPKLRAAIERERGVIHPLYSGLPSTTPAVQGELFYGVRAAVPAFAFGERATGEVVEMLEAERAESVEREIAAKGNGLLQGGSSYGNIYTGGALESHFSAATLGWNGMFRNVHPASLVVALLFNIVGVVRILAKLVWESVLIAGDLLLGLIGKRDLKREWERVGSRLAIGVLLEESMTMAAEVDIVRGLPIVQFNFLSYDEAGHLRGPDSEMARRALRRIDTKLERVRRWAERVDSRNYSVWVYSDHGQEPTKPFDEVAGRTFHDAVHLAFGREPTQGKRTAGVKGASRGRYLRNRKTPSPSVKVEAKPRESNDELLIAAIGPVGHLYLPRGMADDDVRRACHALAEEHHVPAVLRRRNAETLDVWTADGEFEWPRDAATLIGDHPFLSALGADLVRLCAHRNAGDVVVLGWRQGCDPISFVKEHGAHGGAAPRETGAFVVLPPDAPVAAEEQPFLRQTDLRRGVQRLLGREPHAARKRIARTGAKRLRVVTYNVHSCVGLDGRLSPARIARVLARLDADVVALQELDVMRRRTGGLDQTSEIARYLETEYRLFHPAMSLAEEQYGDAILSRLPMRLIRAAPLPGPSTGEKGRGWGHGEPRGALWAAVEWEGGEVQIINTHLGLGRDERSRQIETLLGPEWLSHPECLDPVIFCGDLNLRPSSPTFRTILGQFRDAQTAITGRRAQNTWFSPLPLARIDHVLIRGDDVDVIAVEIPRSPTTHVASDHLPLVVDLAIRVAAPTTAQPRATRPGELQAANAAQF